MDDFDAVHVARLAGEASILNAAANAVALITPDPDLVAGKASEPIQPTSQSDRSKNQLRPTSLAEVVGQSRAKKMMRQVIDAAISRGEKLDHCLLIGPAGTGKTTFANIIANELGRDCYQVAAPVSFETLMDLKDTMRNSDVLAIDEIHMQAVQERRGKEAMSSPEVFLSLLEDGVIASPSGMVPFPDVTIIGATTDPGMLPDPFLDRFPLQPRLDRYSPEELAEIAQFSATRLDMEMSAAVAKMFAEAARGTPRIVGNYVRNAAALVGGSRLIEHHIAQQVLEDLNRVTWEGLTPEMQGTLRYLYENCRRENKDGEVTHQASIGSIATAIGLSRDTKAVQLRVEPYLIERGYLQVGSRGRALTERGVQRAEELINGG